MIQVDGSAVVRRWRAALLATLEPIPPDTPLLLSGGMDSLALLAALVELGRRPFLATYRLADRPSADSAMAGAVAADYGLPLAELRLRVDAESVERLVRTVIGVLGTARKTAVECASPTLLLALELHRRGYGRVIAGSGGIVEDNRSFVIALRAAGGTETPALRAYRRSQLLGTAGSGSATEAMWRAAAAAGVTLVEPYSTEPLASTALSIPAAELNRPRQKGIALRAFPSFFGYPDRLRYWHRNCSLQSASGLREAFAAVLLDSPRLNARRHRAVRGVYGDLLAGRV